MKYITEKGIKTIEDAVNAAYAEGRETVELPVIPMLAVLFELKEVNDKAKGP